VVLTFFSSTVGWVANGNPTKMRHENEDYGGFGVNVGLPMATQPTQAAPAKFLNPFNCAPNPLKGAKTTQPTQAKYFCQNRNSHNCLN